MVEPQLLDGIEIGAAVDDGGREERSVEAARARAGQHVDLGDDVQLAAQVDVRVRRGVATVRGAFARVDEAEDLVHHPSDPDCEAHAAVQCERKSDLGRHTRATPCPPGAKVPRHLRWSSGSYARWPRGCREFPAAARIGAPRAGVPTCWHDLVSGSTAT